MPYYYDQNHHDYNISIKENESSKTDQICGVCFNHNHNINSLVVCTKCKLTMHPECIGRTILTDDNEFLCPGCEECENENIRINSPRVCQMCPYEGGIVTSFVIPGACESEILWAHHVCVNWIPELEWRNTATKSGILGFNRTNDRFTLCCKFCKSNKLPTSKVGLCIQCSEEKCYAAYHVTCAYAAGIEMSTYIDDMGREIFMSRCAKHKTVETQPINLERLGMHIVGPRLKSLKEQVSSASIDSNQFIDNCTNISEAVEKIEARYYEPIERPQKRLRNALAKINLAHHVAYYSENLYTHPELNVFHGEHVQLRHFRDIGSLPVRFDRLIRQSKILLDLDTIAKYDIRGFVVDNDMGVLLWNVIGNAEGTRFVHVPFCRGKDLTLTLKMLDTFFREIQFEGIILFRVPKLDAASYVKSFADAYAVKHTNEIQPPMDQYFCIQVPRVKPSQNSHPSKKTSVFQDANTQLTQQHDATVSEYGMCVNVFDWFQSCTNCPRNATQELMACRAKNAQLLEQLSYRILTQNFQTSSTQRRALKIRSSRTYENDDDEPCRECYGVESIPGNQIVFCDACQEGVHELCHQTKIDLKSPQWYCINCERGQTKNKCIIDLTQ